eukprot:CAMPEP_0194442502 /NCGR_PEP_ID=MMETSP0176-20130528/126166_1 /TAXON_ID=216777 /ORGANISM="Proboscia alata, Strain PI-D3" /LENGTH=435 /DNA_ID=CAMNT_0039268607 /DNA_START=27 /DNA_END=1335 /DNA_ORIENTATION=-
MTNEKQFRHDSSIHLRFLLATVFGFALILPASSFTPPPLLSSSRVSPKITHSTSLNEHVVSQEAFAKKCAHVCLGVLLTVSQLTPPPSANALDLPDVSFSLPEVSLSLPTVTLSFHFLERTCRLPRSIREEMCTRLSRRAANSLPIDPHTSRQCSRSTAGIPLTARGIPLTANGDPPVRITAGGDDTPTPDLKNIEIPSISLPPKADLDTLAPGIKIWSSKFNEATKDYSEQSALNKRIKEEEKQANIAKYEQMFKDDARERDLYYGKIAVESMARAQAMQGSEEAVAAPVYGYNEGKSFLVEKLAVEQQRSTENMSVTERKEFEKQQKILQRRIELEESLQKLRSDQNAGQKEIQAREQLSYEKQQLSIQRAEEAKLKEKLAFQERQLAAQKELEIIKDRQNQRVFEGKMEAFDKFDAREDQLNALREAAQQGK